MLRKSFRAISATVTFIIFMFDVYWMADGMVALFEALVSWIKAKKN